MKKDGAKNKQTEAVSFEETENTAEDKWEESPEEDNSEETKQDNSKDKSKDKIGKDKADNDKISKDKSSNDKSDKDKIEVEIIDLDEEEAPPKKGIAAKFRRFKRSRVGGVIWQLLTSLILLAIAAGIGAFLAVGKAKGGPEVFGEKYFGYFSSNNWYNMYKNTEIEESKFINLQTFSRAMLQRSLEGEVEDFEVSLEEKDGDYAVIRVDYTMKESEDIEYIEGETTGEEESSTEKETPEPGKTYTIFMSLKRQPERLLLFYTTWKGSVDEYIIDGCKIEAPKYAKVTFDNTDVSDCYEKDNEETGNAVYNLGRVFKGEHTIVLSAEGMDNKVEIVNWQENNSSLVVKKDDIPLKSEHQELIKDKSQEILLKYYDTAFKKGNADGIKELIMESEEGYANAEQQLKAMLADVNKEDGRTLVKMQINSIKYTISDYEYMDSASIDIEYSVSYTAKTGRTVLNGHRRTYEGSNTASAKVMFKYVEDKWQIVDTEISCVDYSVENVEEN